MADRHSEELRTFAHLAGLLDADFPRELLDRRARIVVGPDVLDSPAGQALVLTVARLAPRFCHRIDFVCDAHKCLDRLCPLLDANCFDGDSLADLARLIWPEGEFTSGSNEPADIVVGLGCAGDLSIGVTADGAARASVEKTVPVAAHDAVFAALVAAGLGCSILAKLLYPTILEPPVAQMIELAQGALGGPLDLAERLMLERPIIAGVGAIGCALVYALIVAGTSGSVLLLDPDVVGDSNLMRYVLFDNRHLDMLKVDAAKLLVEQSGLNVRVETDKQVLQIYLAEHPEARERMELVVSAVDTYDARREIAAELPREILNAGTSARDFTVSRHLIGDGYACLACLYQPRSLDTDAAAVMARELRLTKDEVFELRRSKAPLTPELLARVEKAQGVSPGTHAPFVGEPIDSFYNKVACGNSPVQTERGEAVAPLAYGSALAGFLLGQALQQPIEACTARHFRMDVMNGHGIYQRREPRPRASCVLCNRPAILRIYREHWR